MFGADTVGAGSAMSVADLDQATEWERAAHLLDLDASLMSRLRQPQLECVSRHYLGERDSSRAVSMHIAADHVGLGRRVAFVSIGANVSSSDVASQLQELSLQSALVAADICVASVGLDLSFQPIEERELWRLSGECAGIVSRTLGRASLVSSDVPSATFALWMAHAASQFGNDLLTVLAFTPQAALDGLRASIADSVFWLSSLALRESGKNLRGAKVSLIGTTPTARRCMQAFSEAGARVVAIADQSGALMNLSGDISPLLRHLDGGGLLVEYEGAEHGFHSEAIAASADLLILDGHELELTDHNAPAVRASIVVEASGSGSSYGASKQLSDRGVTVIPRLFTHCVRVFPEMCLRSEGCTSQEKQMAVHARLHQVWKGVSTIRKANHLPVHSAVLVLALQQLAERVRPLSP